MRTDILDVGESTLDVGGGEPTVGETSGYPFSKPNSNQLLEHTNRSLKAIIDLLQKPIAQSFCRRISNVT